ncbi:hypothetical protein [Hyphomicrobium facile]|uniref:Histone deacetylase n=1 Tax=Hyphomicrobium facile TaxID=51670 RepID=A0A1I7MX21_9HYPH|nr:hypothetical protein [Hyphomicrobium facile]SFV26918.1 hypothetical protein SAMN04488557_0631 [Hyphomicrobium facile]
MALWSEGRGLDEVVRKTDNTLNVLVALLLVAFALAAGSYYYGQMNPRVAPAAINAPASAPAAHSDAVHPTAPQAQP